MNSRARACFLALVCIAWSTLAGPALPAYGGAYRTVEESSPQEVVDGIASKAMRGVANVGTGWLEFPKQIYITYREDGFLKAFFVGPLKGGGMMLVRTVSGVVDTATFFIPFPGFYDPLFEPIYVWRME